MDFCGEPVNRNVRLSHIIVINIFIRPFGRGFGRVVNLVVSTTSTMKFDY